MYRVVPLFVSWIVFFFLCSHVLPSPMNALQWIGLGQPVYLPRASPTFAMGSTARKTLLEVYSPIPNTSDSIYISVISFKVCINIQQLY